MKSPFARARYDVVIAGARCAGASTAMLLAQGGLRVLVVDPLPYGSDTLSTHALMRGGVLQLHRWGLLDAVRAASTPSIGATTFHYGDESIEVPIKPKDGVDALFAPRRTVLDPILVDAARAAGAEIVYHRSVVDLLRDDDGRVRGAAIAGPDRQLFEVEADLVIGADGVRSKVARILGAATRHLAPNAACSIYGYWEELGIEDYHWFYEPGVSIGTIPTNGDATCIFALIPRSRFDASRHAGLEAIHEEVVGGVSPELSDAVTSSRRSGKLRAFAGAPGFLRQAHGPGWALVGDAGYFRDPITAHGITDALRESELLSRAILADEQAGLEGYETERNERVRGLLDVTDRIASFEWDLEEAKEQHLRLSREMNAQVDVQRALDSAPSSG